MADAAKKEKIAAAKKKLKQFQQKKTGRASSSSPVPSNGRQEGVNGTNGSPNVRGGLGEQPAARWHHKVAPQNISIGSPAGDSLNESTYSTPAVSSPAQNPRITATASTEKLQQLSRQINGLIIDSSAYLNNEDSTKNSSIADLETRNRDLASLLQKHSQANEQLNKQLQELKTHNNKLQTTLEGDRKGFEERLKREAGSLKEQLQVHIQTIGILVAEKTELQSSLNQSSKVGDTRIREIEELSGRLKASRTRVSELERSFTTASSSSQKHEKSTKEFSKEVDRLKLELYKTNKASEGQQQQNGELAGKLQTKSSECGRLEDQLIDLRGKLEMTELYVEQLKNSGAETGNNSDDIDRLITERSQLQAQVEQYEKAFLQLGSEREQLTTQYQQYLEQLQEQNRQVQTQAAALTDERDTLRKKHNELEMLLQDLSSQQNSVAVASTESEKEKSEMSESLSRLKAAFDALSAKYETQVVDNSQLSRFVTEKEIRIEELEMTVQRLGDSEVDRDQLLDSMQNDKTALSRAMAQNKELKHQLAELQNGFVKMSNDNMDLMTQLTSEQHIAKELATRLSQQEDELKEVREQLSEKEHHLRVAESDTTALQQRNFTQEQVEDRLRHYEAQAQLVDTLQRELTSAQDTINALTNQNSLLHSRISGYENGDNGNMLGGDMSDIVTSLSASIQQLEMERNQVLHQLEDERGLSQRAQDKLQQLQHELAHQTPATLNGDVISKAQFEALQHAMNQLEGKYTRTIRDKADLTDKTEQLEHLIMQLQGETDTIGEYVTLYQHQRSVLRQRQVEKDDYIARLSREREDMQDKLGQLQALVMQLLGERQMLHSYHDNQMAMTNHIVPEQANKKPASSEDWPDYTSSDSDASEVEAIVGGAEVAASPTTPTEIHSKDGLAQPASPTSTDKWNIPQEDHTAQRIMHLLTEIGNSNLVDPNTFSEINFIHCNRCTGRILSV